MVGDWLLALFHASSEMSSRRKPARSGREGVEEFAFGEVAFRLAAQRPERLWMSQSVWH